MATATPTTTTRPVGGTSDPIHVENLKLLDGAGNLKAFCDIRYAEVLICGCRIIQQPGQRAWVSPPQREQPGPDGKRQFYPVVKWSRELRKAISAAVLAVYEGTTYQQPDEVLSW